MCAKKYGVLLVLIVLSLGLWSFASAKPTVEAFNTNNLIRFHVVANSDLPLDQSIKEEVRNAALDVLANQLTGVSDREEARRVILKSLPKLEQVAKSELTAAGLLYQAKAEFGFYNFPTRSYMGFNLPAGRYEAVRLVLGDGKGENWWCVLFPTLCFVDIVGRLGMPVPNRAYPVIQKQNELEDLTMEIEVRFKIIEVWKRSKDLLANISK